MLKQTVLIVIAGAMVGFLYDRLDQITTDTVRPAPELVIRDIGTYYVPASPEISFGILASRPIAESTSFSAVVETPARDTIHSTAAISPAALTERSGLQAPQLATAFAMHCHHGITSAFGHVLEGGGRFGTDRV
jgi:hypothetical protein